VEPGSGGPACPKCNAPNRPGAQFCAACGASMGLQPPPPPPPPPPRVPMRTSGGTEQQVLLAVDQNEAYDRALQALQAAGCELQWQNRPSDIRFGFVRKSAWSTFGFPVSYSGDLAVVRNGPRESQVRFGIKVNWNTAWPVFLASVVVLVLLMMMNPYYASFALLLLIVALGGSAWTLTSSIPQKASATILAQLKAGGVAQGYAPSPQPARPQPPPPQPSPQVDPAPPPPEAARPAGGDAVFDQIKKLAELRDMGAITAADFEAKKADLLARL